MSTKISVQQSWTQGACCDNQGYLDMYERSVKDPEGFWGEQAKSIDWFAPWNKVKEGGFSDDIRIKWFSGGKLNVSYNCLDRHLATRGDQTAIIWEGDDPSVSKKFTYSELHRDVCKFANVLKSLGVKKGDRITIYLPMIPQLAVAMLACTRIGAVHSIVFAGFSPDSLAGRIDDCKGKIVITADEGLRGGKKVPLKENTDAAIEKCPGVEKVIVVKHTGGDVAVVPGPRPRLGRTDEQGLGGLSCPSQWTQKTPCSSSILQARRASPRAFCTRPEGTSSIPR